MDKGFINLSIFYPGGDDITFDTDYCIHKHLPMVRQLLGDAVKGVTLETGVSGGAPGSDPPYAAVVNLYFENIAACNDSFEASAGKIIADVHFFTNSRPFIQIGEVSAWLK